MPLTPGEIAAVDQTMKYMDDHSQPGETPEQIAAANAATFERSKNKLPTSSKLPPDLTLLQRVLNSLSQEVPVMAIADDIRYHYTLPTSEAVIIVGLARSGSR